MAEKKYKSNKKYKCPYCEAKFLRGDLISHVDRKHSELIPEEYTATRVVYDSINKTDHGKCMICSKPVYEWDEKHNKYKNLCDNPKCRSKVREIALARHIKVYNKPTLLDDPDQQEKMLARRKISGVYTFSDGGSVNYTGKYEYKALEFIDNVLMYKSTEVEVPGPVLTYTFNGVEHNYIPDIYIIPANLLIEVKDGGNNPNNRNMPEYRAKQIAKEEMVTSLGSMNYLRLTNNQFDQLLSILADIKMENLDNTDKPSMKFHINEAACPACGGGVPASCATVPKSVTISTSSIKDNGELGPYIFSAPEDDKATYVIDGISKEINKSEFLNDNEAAYTIECIGEPAKAVYKFLSESSKVNLKDIAYVASGKKPLGISEIFLNEYSIKIYDNRAIKELNSYIENAIKNVGYMINNPDLCLVEDVIGNNTTVHSPNGYFMINNNSGKIISTEVYSNRSKLDCSLKGLKYAALRYKLESILKEATFYA